MRRFRPLSTSGTVSLVCRTPTWWICRLPDRRRGDGPIRDSARRPREPRWSTATSASADQTSGGPSAGQTLTPVAPRVFAHPASQRPLGVTPAPAATAARTHRGDRTSPVGLRPTRPPRGPAPPGPVAGVAPVHPGPGRSRARRSSSSKVSSGGGPSRTVTTQSWHANPRTTQVSQSILCHVPDAPSDHRQGGRQPRESACRRRETDRPPVTPSGPAARSARRTPRSARRVVRRPRRPPGRCSRRGPPARPARRRRGRG